MKPSKAIERPTPASSWKNSESLLESCGSLRHKTKSSTASVAPFSSKRTEAHRNFYFCVFFCFMHPDISQPWHHLWIENFHGTWNFSHNFWDNKYQWITTGIQNTLENILREWLIPFPDPLNKWFTSSISITQDPKYALLYSLLYSEKWTSSQYTIKRGKEWSKVLWKIGMEAKPFHPKKYKETMWERKTSLRDFRYWTLSFNNQDYLGPMGGFRWMVWWESNILWNFPVLLWIWQIENSHTMSGWNEVRIKDEIPLESIKAIFVPREKINGIPNTNIPIFPIEDFIQSIKF